MQIIFDKRLNLRHNRLWAKNIEENLIMIKLIAWLKRLLAYSRLLLPIRLPSDALGVESLANSLVELFEPGLELIIKRRVAEAIMHGANSHIFVLKLRFYNEIRMAQTAGAAWVVLENVKKEEKRRAEEAAKEATSPVG